MRKRTNRGTQVAETGGETHAVRRIEADVLEGPETGEGDAAQEYSFNAGETAYNHLEYLEAMIASTPDAIFAIDQHFHVRSFNPSATQMLQWSPLHEVGRSCLEILKCRNMNGTVLCGTSSCPLTRTLGSSVPLTYEELIVGAMCEHSCETSISATRVRTDIGPLVVFTARDRSLINKGNKVRANFVSMVSHELRTPLNSVHGFIDLLMLGHMEPLTSEQRKYLGYAQEGVQQLLAIVEDILFMTRSDSGQFDIKPEPVNIDTLVKQVVVSLQPQAQKAEVILQKEEPFAQLWLMVDPQRMKQVLNNLVTNAIKYTPPEGRVTIRARRLNKEQVEISVVDTGKGITPEDRPHIFERFYQSNSKNQSKTGGYGLGLAIAKLIVEQHGGKIDLETKMNEGTTFFFTAPLYRREKKRKPDLNTST